MKRKSPTSAMETLTLEHLPADYAVHVALFKNVKNAAFLHAQLLARNPEFEYAFIDASIVSLLFVMTSVQRSGRRRNPLLSPPPLRMDETHHGPARGTICRRDGTQRPQPRD